MGDMQMQVPIKRGHDFLQIILKILFGVGIPDS